MPPDTVDPWDSQPAEEPSSPLSRSQSYEIEITDISAGPIVDRNVPGLVTVFAVERAAEQEAPSAATAREHSLQLGGFQQAMQTDAVSSADGGQSPRGKKRGSDHELEWETDSEAGSEPATKRARLR